MKARQARQARNTAIAQRKPQTVRSFKITTGAAFWLALCGGLGGAGPLAEIGSAHAAKNTRDARLGPEDSLPAGMVLTNLRSPTGRSVYLFLRPEPSQARQIEERAQHMARRIGAQARVRAAAELWIVVFTHKDRELVLHRWGDQLRIVADSPATPVPPAGGVPLRAGQSDGDMDQEIMLQARRVMEHDDETPAALVTQAQGAAARLLLTRYVDRDDVGAALWGRRSLPLLLGHPDAELLRQIVEVAGEAMEVPVNQVALLGPPAQDADLWAWEQSLAAADRGAERARDWLRADFPKQQAGQEGATAADKPAHVHKHGHKHAVPGKEVAAVSKDAVSKDAASKDVPAKAIKPNTPNTPNKEDQTP